MTRDLQSAIIAQLLVARAHANEIEIRRNLSDAERLGQFCTHLRRLPVVHVFGDVSMWKAPMVPSPMREWPKSVFFATENQSISYREMLDLCEKVNGMSDTELELEAQLSILTTQLPALSKSAFGVERLTRQAEQLLTEANTFATQQEQSA